MPPYNELNHQPLPRVGDVVRLSTGVSVAVRGVTPPYANGVALVGLNANGELHSVSSREFRLYRRLRDGWVWGLVPRAEQAFLATLGRQTIDRLFPEQHIA